jgi:hypothetical protein
MNTGKRMCTINQSINRFRIDFVILHYLTSQVKEHFSKLIQLYYFMQGCGTGLDQDSVTLWIRGQEKEENDFFKTFF